MKILVTGANGFIGRHLCFHLTEQKHSVKAVVRQEPKAPIIADEVIVLPDGSPLTTNLFDSCESIVHLAARVHILKNNTENSLEQFRNINVDMTQRWVEAAIHNGIRRFVLVSSIGMFGPHKSGIPFTETMPVTPIEPYAISKLEAEDSLSTSCDGTDMDYVIIRPPLVYGPDAPGNFALLLKLFSLGFPLPFGSLDSQRSFVSVWNLVDFIRCCLLQAAAKNEVFVVCDKEFITLPEIFQYLGEGYGRYNRVFRFPPILLALAAGLLGKSNAFDKLVADLQVDANKARQILNWVPPYSAADAMRKTGQDFHAMLASNPQNP
ncbi:MAG: NAD-dependent epimerase/dehydratase family protein [Candidatus Accumulibacter sp.]|jgi:nucleoside-diphosphate-sugar epimerase|uniref:NAD-dependent epimerase/dehydratase family protein n=1 Tax=Accumulibacter sp. TaxID=2053492 RepID=UPI00258D7EEB|nr:NAD-dependent epimerase/dehydratase family protein [Accumulibacter sp.]MBK8115186.1 NAD-dependent epimerase/dehydratase family protein [Accumulibacter sp.]